MNDATQTLIELALARQGLNRWGLAAVSRPHSFEHYRRWVEDGKHGEMTYLRDHLPQKETPALLLPQVKSAIVVAVDYFPAHPEAKSDFPLKSLPIAAYAKGTDYHFWLRAKLEAVIAELKRSLPDEEFLPMTDSHPVMERDLARRAGLGWFAKNTCLLDAKHGSFFLIGEIFSSLQPGTAVSPHPDQCGTCTRCMDACPTKAITAPRELDARQCISYWTIESRGVPPPELRKAVGSWLFGCDICQQVCPWNEKVFGRTLLAGTRSAAPALEDLTRELKWIFSSSNNQLQRAFAGTPLTRTGGRGLKRNAILVAVHHRITELKDDIRRVSASHSELAELGRWAIAELG